MTFLSFEGDSFSIREAENRLMILSFSPKNTQNGVSRSAIVDSSFFSSLLRRLIRLVDMPSLRAQSGSAKSLLSVFVSIKS